MLKLSETSWEKVALTKWGSYLSGVEQRTILRAQKLAGPPASALEIGCEGGRWSLMLSQLGWRMTCTDVNKKSLTICQKRVPTASCILADPSARTIPCDSNCFDLLVCIEVPPVMESDWFPGEAHRILKDNAFFVGVSWNRTSIRGLLSRIRRKFNRSNGGYYKLPYRTWRQALLKFNFQLVYQEGCCWGPFRRTSNSPLVPLCVKLERLLQLPKIVSLSPWIMFIARKTG